MKTFENFLLERAEKGDVKAMLEIGRIYSYKINDFEKGIFWFEKAFEKGCGDACIELARAYEQLDIIRSKKYDGAVIDYEISKDTIFWYETALLFYELNYKVKPEYAFMAGELLSGVDAIEMDHVEAFKYFKYVADLEDENEIFVKIARRRVASMYRIGLGCKKDLDKSKYYREISGYEEYMNYKIF